MIVCLCNGVNDRELKVCIDHGHKSIQSVAAACGAGGDCGRCVKTIKALLKNTSAGEPSTLSRR